MYSTGEVFRKNKTGGNKRFIEIAGYLQKHYGADLCCSDEKEMVEANGFTQTYRITEPDDSIPGFLPEEIRILMKNRGLLKQIRAQGYDYVISFDVPPTVGLGFYKVKNIVLMIRKDLIGYYDITHENTSKAKKLLERSFLMFSEWFCMRKSRIIVTQCDYDKQRLIERHPTCKAAIDQKTRIQINNVNPSWAAKNQAKACAGGKNICFIGNFNDSRKGHDLLLPCAREITASHPDVTFHIIGGGKDLDTYRQQYESSQIRFYGYLRDPMAILETCDLNVVPSKADSCPNTVMESLNIGVPVIGSNVGGIPEILLDPNGMFEMTEESLRTKIQSLIDDPEALRTLKEAQRARKETLTFDWGEVMSKVILGE